MSTLFIDLKYAKLLGGRLPNFKQKKNGVYAFSHSCEDFSKSRVKARANFYQQDGSLKFHCYHCSVGSYFSNFLRSEDPSLYSEYRLEVFKETSGASTRRTKQTFLFPSSKEVKEEKKTVEIDKDIILLKDLHPESGVMLYVKKRKIPEIYWDKIGAVGDFNKFAAKYDDTFKELNTIHARLIFPFFDEDGSIICYSGRAFGNEQPKYITVMIDKTRPKIYGLWKVDKKKDILALEGQIDTLFLDNAIAVNGADYSLPFLKENKEKIIIVPDSDWKRNKQVFQSLEKVIDDGFRVSLFPDSIPWKDINDCVVKGNISKEKLMNVIMENVTSGLKAKLEINYRKKL